MYTNDVDLFLVLERRPSSALSYICAGLARGRSLLIFCLNYYWISYRDI